ncbi:MAG TPA: nucleoside-diphosphate sugar epimerase/dehydratase [Terriglobales bacterium]|jgi:FlaA1/EpsC-like NDP-sugar epimerase|nr:nucleoside-diphosphate sugar epimerase/dehydratase [Terriglobales bacterium]
MLLRWRNWIIFLGQSLTVCAALVAAWLLRFDFTLPRLRVLLLAVPVLVAIRLIGMYYYKLNHGYWRYTGIGDLKDLVKAVSLGSLMFFIVERVFLGVRSFPYSIYVLEGVLAFLFLAGLRVGARMVFQWKQARRLGAQTPVLIVGAGSAAALLLQGLKTKNYLAAGLVDDDPEKQRTKLCGVPVLGTIDQLPLLAHRLAVSEILIAIPSATGTQMLRIADFCGRSGVPFRALPGLADLIDGKVTISELRAVNLDDLLGREPVRLESENVRSKLSGRVVMVTGAAGSIGSELCKQIVRYLPKKLICVDQSETPLFNLQQHTLAGSDVETVFSVADITDTKRMRQQLLEHGVRVIFHAAAYKHVPMTEENPYEGFKNNVFGLLNLVEIAEECGCEDFLLISSDKAVKPSSLMGCTKRLGEMIVGSRQPSRMRCVSVRFGNVLGSQGSVIPVFQEQIRTRRCITVTHPEMTRYFMTIPEAVSLVLQAFTVGEHGNILVLDMGEPVRILDLAKTLIRMSGKKESDIHIVYTGMRPGEKLHEELFYDSEVRLPTLLPKVMCAETVLPSWSDLRRRLYELEMVAHGRFGDLVRAKVKQIIPAYQWESESKTRPEVVPLTPALLEQHAHANRAQQSKFA